MKAVMFLIKCDQNCGLIVHADNGVPDNGDSYNGGPDSGVPDNDWSLSLLNIQSANKV